eukprot:290078_1
MKKSGNVNLSERLVFTELMVSEKFDSHQIGECVQNIIIQGEYETANEVLEDLQDINDSTIIPYVSNLIQSSDKMKNAWNGEKDEKQLHKLLLEIFNLDIKEISKRQTKSLPNSLNECNIHHILIIAMHHIKFINKKKPNSFNINNVKRLIIHKKLNGFRITNFTGKQFCIIAEKYDIAASKARKLLTAIKKHNKFKSKTRITADKLDWTGVTNIVDCTHKHIAFLMIEYMFPDLTNKILNNDLKAELSQSSNKIIECIKNNNFNGQQIRSMSSETFCNKIVTYCDNIKLFSIAKELYNIITTFDLNHIQNVQKRVNFFNTYDSNELNEIK